MSSRITAAVALVAGLVFGVTTNAFGFGGRGSQAGDSWLNDAQKNPRFIEPGADSDPSRYRASHPQEGWYDRQSGARYGAERRRSRSGY